MMVGRPFHPAVEALPSSLAIFPLPGVLLLPDGKLPLTIFEPRYMAMVRDALGNGRMLGMIQPTHEAPEGMEPPIFDTGCMGRISSFDETGDGRLMMTLTGVCRFKVAAELDLLSGYRRIRPDWGPYLTDLEEPAEIGIDRSRLITALKAFSRLNNLEFNWKAIERIADYDLSVALCMACPLEPAEKQALLESPTAETRTETLITLMEMAVAGRRQAGGAQVPQ
jgi:Lon protease-like protein